MLKLVLEVKEAWDDELEEFQYETIDVELEHSLVALSKWESEFEKPFLGKEEKTQEEVFAYIKAMAVNENLPDGWINFLTNEQMEQITKYIDAKMTATWFSDVQPEAKSNETITSELIYYWMTVATIPWEAQYWHLNRLFTLLKITTVKNTKPKKMSHAEMAARRRALNDQRRKEWGTNG